MKRFLLYTLVLLLPLVGYAQPAAGYYTAAALDGLNGQTLELALKAIVYPHTQRSYSQLWTDYETTDPGPADSIPSSYTGGKTDLVYDMYAWMGQFPKFYSDNDHTQTSGFNREHCVPNSWWGGESGNGIAYTDLHHLVPGDGAANNAKGNYALGEYATGMTLVWPTATKTNTSGYTYVVADSHSHTPGQPCYANASHVWKPSNANQYGGSANLYEPADEYKGDFARMYLYVVCAYEGELTWQTNYMFTSDANKYTTILPWAKNLLLRWHRQDPVSDKERARNNAVYGIQNNRNPFIDYPELVEYIWGHCSPDSANQTFVFADAVSAYSDDYKNGNTGRGTTSVTLLSIEASGTPSELWVGDTFNHDGITITATMDDGTNKDVTAEAVFSTPDMSSAGAKTVTVTYQGKQTTYNITISTIANTQATAYTVAEAIALINAGKDLYTAVYVTGTVSQITTAFSSTYGNISFDISADGSTEGDQFLFFRNFKGADNTKYTDASECPAVGDIVVGYGTLTLYNTTYEFKAGNYIVSLEHPAVDCTVSWSVNGAVTEETVTKGAAITFNDPSATTIAGRTFMGWSESPINGATNTAPTFVSNATCNGDITFYAIYATVEESTSAGPTQEASVNINTYATNNNWTNATKYSDLTILSDVLSATIAGGGNSGKYYTKNNSWRMYQTENATLTISAGTGYELESVTVTYVSSNTGVLLHGEDQITSKTKLSVSGSSVLFGIGNTNDTVANGQAQITGIAVEYHINTLNTTYSDYCTAIPTLTVSAVGYATYYNSVGAYSMPGDCVGYIWDKTQNKLVETYQADAVVPAGEPLVIYSENAGTKTVAFTDNAKVKSENNALLGTDTETALSADADAYFYALSLNAAGEANSVGFYWMNNTGAAFTNGAHKAYLKLAKTPGAPDRYLFESINDTPIATGLENTASSPSQGEVGRGSKRLINAQLFIVREGQTFNINGRLIK